MKHMIKTTALVALVLAFLTHGALAAAPVSIGIVDIQALLAKSKAGISLQQQIETKKNEFLNQIADQEKKLRDEEKTLAAQKTNPPTDDFIKKAKAFEAKLNDSRKSAQDKKKSIETAAGKSLDKLRTQILSVVADIAKEKGFTVVINRVDVIYGDDSLNVTDEALAKLDKALPSITLDTASN